jgi:hypothetical protein
MRYGLFTRIRSSSRGIAALTRNLSAVGVTRIPGGADCNTASEGSGRLTISHCLSAPGMLRLALVVVVALSARPAGAIGAAGASSECHRHISSGQTLYEQGKHDAAIEEFTAAVALEPSNSMAHLWLGRALGRRAEKANMLQAMLLVGKVRAEFEHAVALDPMNVEARSDLLEFYLEAPACFGGGLDKAEQQADAITKLDDAEGGRAHSLIAARRNENKIARHEDRPANR